MWLPTYFLLFPFPTEDRMQTLTKRFKIVIVEFLPILIESKVEYFALTTAIEPEWTPLIRSSDVSLVAMVITTYDYYPRACSPFGKDVRPLGRETDWRGAYLLTYLLS